MGSTLEGFSGANDEEFVAQVEALMELPLDQRLVGLAEAEQALRMRLGHSSGASSKEADTSL